ncbi:MAG: acyl-CoA dehydrogenase family protein [Cyanobacteria bacterium P01_F01_bin.42]
MKTLTQIDQWMQSHLAPQAQEMDEDSQALFGGFRLLGDRNLLALRLSVEQGGQDWDARDHSQFQMLIASHSGALAFLSTQHQSALRMLGQSPNAALRAKLMPSLIQGQMGLGVGFSQLRRGGTPLMTASPTESGYLLTGTVPWVTGFGCFDGFICGARLPDGQILMGWVPLVRVADEPRYQVSSPLALAAMTSTQTVQIQFSQWPMPTQDVVALHPQDWLERKDETNLLHHGFYSLGSVRAALRLIEALLSPTNRCEMQAFGRLEQAYQNCRQTMLDLLPQQTSAPSACLRAKADAIALAGRTSQAAIAMAGGRANYRHHPAQRIYREVLAFTVFGQTAAARDSTLAALSEI